MEVFIFLKHPSKSCVCVQSWPIYFVKGRSLKELSSENICSCCFDEINSRNRAEPAPAPAKKAPAPTTGVTHSKKLDDGATNPWDLAQIWIESVSKEETTRKQWEQAYGWMAEYDPRVISF